MKTKSKATLGLWSHEPETVSVFAGREKICDVTWHNRPVPEAYRNARLIAAAPEMLASLNDVLGALDAWGNASYMSPAMKRGMELERERIQTVIKKATQ